jgi:hypothetical protein
VTPEATAEVKALLRALRRLATSTARALADGVLSVDELVAIGASDLPALIEAIVDLVRPDAPRSGRARVVAEVRLGRARVVVQAGRALVRRRRAAARLRRLRETRRVAAGRAPDRIVGHQRSLRG